jgi:hypothetical protein
MFTQHRRSAQLPDRLLVVGQRELGEQLRIGR